MAIASYRISIMNSVLFLLPLMIDLIHSVDGGREKNFCNVCRAVVQEVNWKISQADPKKKVQVGSFRVDPRGDQNYVKEIHYARSESHIEEIFESVCNDLADYAELKQKDGSTTIIRIFGRYGEKLETKSYDDNLTRGLESKWRFQCHDFLEDHEESVMGIFQRDNIKNYEKVVCGDETGVCSEKELSVPLIELPIAAEEFDTKEKSDDDDDEEKDEDEEESEDESSDDESSVEYEDISKDNEKDEL